jgi:hypothetical protein
MRNLRTIRRTYEAWSLVPSLARIIYRLEREYPELSDAHSNRIWDFLVWTSRCPRGMMKGCLLVQHLAAGPPDRACPSGFATSKANPVPLPADFPM